MRKNPKIYIQRGFLYQMLSCLGIVTSNKILSLIKTIIYLFSFFAYKEKYYLAKGKLVTLSL